MRVKLLLCIALNLFVALPILAQDKSDATSDYLSPIVSGYTVSFTLSGFGQRNLTFVRTADHRGTFRLPGRTNWEPTSVTTPAVWDSITPSLISFSGEVQFQIGNCCRETGTLIFKGQIIANGLIAGQAVFVTNTPDPTNPTGFVVRTGEFTATPLPIIVIE